jgi:hypothetical protein
MIGGMIGGTIGGTIGGWKIDEIINELNEVLAA